MIHDPEAPDDQPSTARQSNQSSPEKARFKTNLAAYGLAAGATVTGLGLAQSDAAVTVFPAGVPAPAAPPPPFAGVPTTGLVAFNVVGTAGPPAGASATGTAKTKYNVPALASIASGFQFGLENAITTGGAPAAFALAAGSPTAPLPGGGVPALFVGTAPYGPSMTISGPTPPGPATVPLATLGGGGPFFSAGAGSVSGYIGLAFDIDGGGVTPPNFGWANITVAGAGSATPFAVTLTAFAIEGTAGTPIHIPEPSSALLLAAGASGLALLRRRKKTSQSSD